MRRSVFFTLFFLFLLVFSALGLRHAHLELDIYDVLDKNFPASVRLTDMREKFNDVNSAQFVFSAKNGLITAGEACQIQDFFRHYSNNDSRVQSWLSPWHLRKPMIPSKDKLWYFTLLPDPCGLPGDQNIQSHLQRMQETPWALLLTDKLHQDFSINVNFKDEENAEGKKYFDVRALTDLKKKLDLFFSEKTPNLKYEISGQAAFRWHFHNILSKDAIFNLGIVVLFIIFFRVFFGTWKSGFLYIFTLAYTVITLYGMLSWAGFPIDILTNNLFLMTAIAGVADFLFVSSEQEHTDWKTSYKNIILPGFFTTFTTVIGFWSLMVSDLGIIQRFGFAAGCGALLEWTATFLVLPVLLQFFRFKGKWVNLDRAWRPAWLLNSMHMKPNKQLTGMLCVVLLLSLWAGMNLNFSDTPTKNFPEHHELRKAFSNLHEKRGWESSLYLVFAPEASREQQANVLAEVRSQPQVIWIESALDFESFFTKDLSETQKNMVLLEIQPTPLYKRYWHSDGTSRAMILMRSSSVEELNVLSEKIKAVCKELCAPVGQNEVFREYSTKISSTLAESFLLSLAIVLCTLFIIAWYRGFKNYLALAISVIWGPLIMIIFLWVFQIPVNLVTSVFLAVIVGMTGDNAIQFVFGGSSISEGIEKRGQASILLSLLLCTSSLTFLGQTLIPVRWLGILFFLGFAATLFGDLWALKGLLSINDQKLASEKTDLAGH